MSCPGDGCHKSAIRLFAVARTMEALAGRLVLAAIAPSPVRVALGAVSMKYPAERWGGIVGWGEGRGKAAWGETGQGEDWGEDWTTIQPWRGQGQWKQLPLNCTPPLMPESLAWASACPNPDLSSLIAAAGARQKGTNIALPQEDRQLPPWPCGI